MANHREVDEHSQGREQTRRGQDTLILDRTLVSREQTVIVISSRHISTIRNPVMMSLQQTHFSKNSPHGRCLSFADTRTGHLRRLSQSPRFHHRSLPLRYPPIQDQPPLPQWEDSSPQAAIQQDSQAGHLTHHPVCRASILSIPLVGHHARRLLKPHH